VADPYLRSWLLFAQWLVEVAPSERAEIAAPTLVIAGGRDATSRPPLCRAVADLIPGAQFEVMEEEAHQPFQEVPEEWNARVDGFWQEVEARS
jgi:pimeloyl-ACP methyl ester carboxylesterase